MSEWLSISLAVLGGLGVLFSIYQYYASKKSAQLSIETNQLSDFGLPDLFYHKIEVLPIAVTLQSTGNTSAEKIVLHLKTRAPIKEYLVATDEKWEIDLKEAEITFRVDNLNPGDSFRLIAYCTKTSPVTATLIDEVKVTLSEGRVLNKSALKRASTQKEYFDIFLESYPLGFTKSFIRLMTRSLFI